MINYFYIFINKMKIKKTKACRSRRNACRDRRNARRRSTRRKTGGVNIGYIAPPPEPPIIVQQPNGPDFSVRYHPDPAEVYDYIIADESNNYRDQMRDGSYTVTGRDYAYRILPMAEYDALWARLRAHRVAQPPPPPPPPPHPPQT